MAGKKVVCIEIRQSFIRAVEMSGGSKKPVILKAVEFPTPDNSFSDGYITDTELVSECLKENLTAYGIKTKNIVFVLVSNKVMSREAEMPMVKKSQLKNAVAAQADEYFPMDISEHIISYIVTDSDKKEKTMKLMLYAVPADMVDDYYDLAAMAGLKLESVDYTGNSSYQWMRQNLGNQSVMMVQVSKNSSMLTIMSEGVLMMQRNINYGAEDLIEATKDCGLALDDEEAMSVLRKNRHLNPYLPGHIFEESEIPEDQVEFYQKTLKVGDGVSKKLSEDEARELSEKIQINLKKASDEDKYQYNEVITEAARQMVSNTARFLEYYMGKQKDEFIDKIILTGMGCQVLGFAELLKNEIGVEVITVNEIPGGMGIKGIERFNGWNPTGFISLIGAVINPINFMPEAMLAEMAKKNQTKSFMRILVLVVILCVLIVVLAMSNYISARSQNKELQQDRDNLSYVQAIYDEYQHASAVNAEVKAIDDSTDRNNEILNRLFSELELYLPSSTVITSMSSTGDNITMSMTVNNKETAAKLLLQLKQVPYLSDVYISGLTDELDETTGARKVSFTLTCFYSDEALDVEDDSAGADEGAAVGEAGEQGADPVTEIGETDPLAGN